MQAAPSQVASGAQLTSCTAWRQGAVAQAVQILKQTPEGSRWGPLDSQEHTDFSPAGRPEAPQASCRTWRCGAAAQADLDQEAERVELRAPA